MFDAAFNSMAAFNIIGLILGGLLLLAIGALILGDFAWWRLKAQRFTAVIIGVRAKEKQMEKTGRQTIYYPVLEYKGADGQIVQAETDSGSSHLASKIPGRKVDILVLPRDPHTARVTGYTWLVIGLLFAVPGVGLLGLAWSQFDFNIYTVVIGLGVLGYGGFKFSKIIKPRDEWETVESFRARKRKENAEKRKALPMLDAFAVRERLKTQDRKLRVWAPAYMVIGLALAGLGMKLALDMKYTQTTGIAAQGKVINLLSEESSSPDGGYVYYPVVEFKTVKGLSITFKDKVGSNPPMHQRGDAVSVIYDPEKPGKAIIDRGPLNWVPAALSFLAGVLLLWGGVYIMMDMRSRAVCV